MDRQTQEQPSRQQPRKGNAIYRFLSSMKVGVVLLLIVTGACVLGTMLPQNQPAELYLKHYGEVFGRLFLRLGLTHTFSSWWFNSLAALLAASLLTCSWRRLRLLLRAHRPKAAVSLAHLQAMKAHSRFSSSFSSEETARRLADWMQRRGYRVLREDSSAATCLFAQKGRLAEWGVLIVHISLLVILLGALYGNSPTLPGLWRTRAYNAEANLMEGEKFTVRLPQRTPFQVELMEAEREMSPGGVVKDYRSRIRIWEAGRPVESGLIEMNRPVYHQGVSMTMAQYREPRPELQLLVEAAKQEPERIPIPLIAGPEGLGVDMMATITRLRANGWRVFVHDVLGAALEENGQVALAADGRPREPQQEEEVVPALSVFVVENPDEEGMRNWQRVGYVGPAAAVDYKGVKFRLHNRSRAGAVLSLHKDPGIPIVYGGFALLMLGVMLAFYIGQRIVRIRLWEEKGQARVAVGVRSRGGLAWAETELERLRSALKSQ